jgi:predicted hydrocarbon binding protein
MPPLRTVRVPEGFVAPFAQAEEVVSRYFSLRKDDPEHGSIEIAGERYVLVRAASLSVEFFAMVQDLYGPGREPEADEFARNILYDLAHAIGRSDAQNFHARMGVSDPIARLSAGPVHFAHTGWAFVDIDPSSHASSDGEFYLLYEHPYSFEADAWLRSGKQRDFTACIMNAGYSSGWCEASFGLDLVSTEVLCRARGDASCRFIMAPPHRIEERVHAYLDADKATPLTPHTYQIPDFFARKRMEEELRQAHGALERRVAERTAELTQSNERLRSEMLERQRAERRLAQANKLEALGRLAGGIAHDFNNLMAIVIANAGLLERRLPTGEPTRAFVEEILGASARAAQLTRQLLAFGRPVVRAQETLQPGPIVGELSRMLGRVIGEEITLTTRLDPDAGFVEPCRAPSPAKTRSGNRQTVALRAVHLPLAREERDGSPAHVDRREPTFSRPKAMRSTSAPSLARDPARELDVHRLEADVGVVLVLQPVLHDLELQAADGAEDGVPLAPFRRRYSWIVPSCASCSSPFLSCLRRSGSTITTRAKCSGAKLGISSKKNFLPGGERVADLEDARVVDADDVAGEALLHDRALLREERRRVREADRLVGADVEHLHPALEAPEQMRMKATRSRCALSMFAWILKTKPLKGSSSGSTLAGELSRG